MFLTSAMVAAWSSFMAAPTGRVIQRDEIVFTGKREWWSVLEYAPPGEEKPYPEIEVCATAVENEIGGKGTVVHFNYGHLSSTRRKGAVQTAEFYRMPMLADGELCPMFGGIWRGQEGVKARSIKAVPDTELPEGVPSVDRYSIVLPLTRGFNEGTSFNGMFDERSSLPWNKRKGLGECNLHMVGATQAKDGRPLMGRVLYKGSDGEAYADVSAGDILVIGRPVNAGLVVRAVVPPDAKTKAVGWVELSGFYTPLDEVEQVSKDEKRKVVRLAEVKK